MLLTKRQVAERLGVSEKTVHRLRGRGKLTAVLVSDRAVRYESDEVDRFIAERRAS